jgi:hypothetical protein
MYVCVSYGYWIRQYMYVSHMVIGAGSICMCLLLLLDQVVYVCVSYGYWSRQYMYVSQMVIGANTDHLPKQC